MAGKVWLPQSLYEAVNLEYERHTAQSTGRRPVVELLFAIPRKVGCYEV